MTLTTGEMHTMMSEEGYVQGTIEVDLNELIGLDLEQTLDLFSEYLTETDLLMDIQYKVIDFNESTGGIVIEITGDASMIELENEE